MSRAYESGLFEMEEEVGGIWGSGLRYGQEVNYSPLGYNQTPLEQQWFVQPQPETESSRRARRAPEPPLPPLPPLDPTPFGGNAQLRADARQLAQLRGSRVVNIEVQRQYQLALQAAERAARRARSNVAAARAAVSRPDPAQVQMQATASYEAWLTEDYRLTMEGARARYGNKWRKQMRSLGPTERQAYYANQIAQVSRAWLISRREQLDFITIASPNVRSLPPSFRPPAAEVQRVVSRLIPGSEEEPVAPIVVSFVQELKKRYRGFSASTYRDHGGGAFLRRGYSIDIFLDTPLDDRGFYPRGTAEAFLRQLHETARVVNVEWRALYNDFAVADAINRTTGVRHVVFIGSPRTVQRGGTKYGAGLNWHGPHPLILHFHLDIVPRDGTTNSEYEGEWQESNGSSPQPSSSVRIASVENPRLPTLERGVLVRPTVRFTPACNDPRDLIMSATAAVEGGYDSVNMYDLGIVSWGILQSAAHAGPLQELLGFIKQRRPDLFQQYFGRYGLDVVRGQFVYQGKAFPIEERQPGAPVPKNTALRLLFRGRAERGAYDEQVIRRWATVFASAGRDPAVQELQRQFARTQVDTVLNGRRRILRGHSPEQLLRGNVTALATFFSLRVNNPKRAYLDLQNAVNSAGGPQAGADRIAAAFYNILNASTFNHGRWRLRARAVPAVLNAARKRCR
jgi:hypothetical protein